MALHFFRGAMAKEMPEHPLSGIWRGIDDGFFPMLVGKLWAFTYRAVSFFYEQNAMSARAIEGMNFCQQMSYRLKYLLFSDDWMVPAWS